MKTNSDSITILLSLMFLNQYWMIIVFHNPACSRARTLPNRLTQGEKKNSTTENYAILQVAVKLTCLIWNICIDIPCKIFVFRPGCRQTGGSSRKTTKPRWFKNNYKYLDGWVLDCWFVCITLYFCVNNFVSKGNFLVFTWGRWVSAPNKFGQFLLFLIPQPFCKKLSAGNKR